MKAKTAVLLAALVLGGCASLWEGLYEDPPPRRRFPQDIVLGMTTAEVRAMRRPAAINRTVTANSVHEQWVYRPRGRYGTIYLYFDNGLLTAWQD